MTEHCVDLDAFFDGELAGDEAEAFRDHLATCDRCQSVLGGRIHEELIVSLGQAHTEPPVEEPVAGAVAAAGHLQAAGDRRGWFHRWWAAIVSGTVGTAVAAGVCCVVCLRAGDRPADHESVASGSAAAKSLDLALVIDSGKAKMRGYNPHLGDTLFPSVRGDAYQALWIFHDGRDLVIACPDNPLCKSSAGELSVKLELTAHGRYTIVAVGSTEPINVPAGTYDSMMVEVTKPSANKHVQVQHLDVD